MRRALIGVLILALALIGTAVLAQDKPDKANNVEASKVQRPIPQEAVDKIKLLLSGYDYFPTREKLEEATPRAHEVLYDIIKDDKALPSLRTRALDALGLFKGKDEVALLLEVLLAEQKLDSIYMRHAVTSSMKAFGKQALPWIAPYLSHEDVQLRLSAVYALGDHGGDEGREILRSRIDVERDKVVLKRIQRFSR